MVWEYKPGGTGAPNFQSLRQSNLVVLLENFEDAKMSKKVHVSGDFRRSKFQNFPGSMLRTPLTNLRLRTVAILSLFQHT